MTLEELKSNEEHNYLVSYVVTCTPNGKKTVENHFGNQMFVCDKLNVTAYENILKTLERRFENDGRVTIIAINELDD